MKNQCNICGHPSTVIYREKDKETGVIVTKQHIVACLGHIGIFPHLWNKHQKHEKYRRYLEHRRQRTGAS
jgi:hypothetical protein